MLMVDRQLEQEIDLLHSRICQALADPKRILILYTLVDGPKYVNELADELDLPQPTASRHLAILRERGLVQSERQGTAVYYTLADRRIMDALEIMRAILATQLNADAGVIQSS
jgi:DNA-binding transcriptional ArsR family regulator